MKTTRNKKPKRRAMRSISALKKDADMWFSRRVRLRDADSKGYCRCISCGSRLHWKQMHNCHFIVRGNYFYRRDPMNCHAGCVSCNKYHKEYHMMMYTLYMVKTHWLKEVQKMQDTHWELKKVKREMLEEIIEEYKELVEDHPLYQ